MGPSEASVHCGTGDQTGKGLQNQWSFAPVTLFKSHPRSESSPDPGSAHSTCGKTTSSQSKPTPILESSQFSKGDCENNLIIRSGIGVGSQKWEDGSCVSKLHAERSKGESLMLPLQIHPQATFVLHNL